MVVLALLFAGFHAGLGEWELAWAYFFAGGGWAVAAIAEHKNGAF